MATDYWISNVGGVECVGAPIPFMRDVYEGGEYVDPNDNDLDDRDYSYLADIDILGGSHDVQPVGSDPLWDNSEVGALFKAKADPFAIQKKVAAAKLLEPGRKSFTASSSNFSSIGGDIVHGLNTVTRLPAKAVKATFGKIPGIGGPINSLMKLSPAAALGDLTAKVASGERIDKAFLKVAKGQIAAARDIAPYVQTVMSIVPGVGTGIAAAIAAGTALADGRTITDAVLSSVKGALPGGALAAGAFDMAVAVGKGTRLDKAAVNAAISQLPPAARKGATVALQLARGKNVKEVLLREVQKTLPAGAAQEAFDVGIAMVAGRNIQSAVVNKLASKSGVDLLNKHGANLLKGSPFIRKFAKGLSAPAQAGYQVAMGAIGASGVNAHAMAAAREKLGRGQRTGFDHAVKVVSNHTNPKDVSMVTRGRVLRGDWTPAKAGTPGATKGRIIRGGKVVPGLFSRGSTETERAQLRKLATLSEADKVKLRAYAANQRAQLTKLARLSKSDQAKLRALSAKEREQLKSLARLSETDKAKLRAYAASQKAGSGGALATLAAMSEADKAALRRMAGQ